MRSSAANPRSAIPALARVLGSVVLTIATLSTAAIAQQTPNFGPNVIVFNPSMPVSQIQTTVDAIANQQVSNQFGTQRYALLFEPGTYGTAQTPLAFQLGYYTEVAGLGASPTDVVINGHVDVYNQCFSANNCSALDNFWRSLANLTINVQGLSGCRSSAAFWAVSQADPMRRVSINGATLTLFDYCTAGPQFASGGFIADTQVQGSGDTVINGSQQQFYVRNSNIDGWTNGVWNQVFTGVIGAPPQSYPNPTYTTLASTPVSRERPFLYQDAQGNYNVFVPAVQRNSVGLSWSPGTTPGTSLPISSFFIANPSSSTQEIDKALAQGQNLILTPGVYALDRAIQVEHPDTIILGLGFPTLVPQTGQEAIRAVDGDGVEVAGLIIDAGPVNSPVLMEMGVGLSGGGGPAHGNDPPLVSDVFFRIGGATAGKATTSLQIDSSDVIVDDVWAWRADHGNGVGWTLNTADHGLVVNGDRVTATGLFVEHYQKEQVLWNGNGGETIFYQSEMPYDPPSQSAWTDGSANGYPSYVVSDNVGTHQAYGLGIYCFFEEGINIIADNAMTVPTTPGVTVDDVGSVFLSGSGQITHVINGVGGTVNSSNAGTLSPVVAYP